VLKTTNLKQLNINEGFLIEENKKVLTSLQTNLLTAIQNGHNLSCLIWK